MDRASEFSGGSLRVRQLGEFGRVVCGGVAGPEGEDLERGRSRRGEF
jgi:hypothetical protein